jgi:serum/glucocorticoid-regulated kinase 2
VPIPENILKALESSAANGANGRGNRDSLQRKRFWWLPYVVLEFDKNEILIDALGGDLANPVWNYRADLCVATSFHGMIIGL